MPKTLQKSIQMTEAKAVIPSKDQTVSYMQTRILLALWTLGEATASQVKTNVVRKREKETKAEYEKRSNLYSEAVSKLDGAGALTTEGNRLSLSAQGLELLAAGLLDAEFVFDAQIGAKTANALLRWMRQNSNGAAAATNSKPVNKAVTSYEEFKHLALEVFDRLNRDFNLDNLVPIYRIRREVGDRVSRSQFSEWLFAMQSEDLLQLLEESVEDSAPDKIQDSVTTKLGKLRCYAKRPK